MAVMDLERVKSQPTNSEDDGSGGEGHSGVTAPTTCLCTTAWALLMVWTTYMAHLRRRRYNGSVAKLNFARLKRSAPFGKAR